MAITLNQHRKHFTQTLIARFSDNQEPKSGFSAFFPTVTTESKYVSIEVQRNKQLVAVDVQRCTDPVRNTFSHSTEKIFMPPYYNESFDFTACQRYDETFGSGNVPTKVDARFLLGSAMEEINSLKNKILRAIELQRSQVLHTGVVLLKNGDSIDYKRKAASMKDLTVSGTPWTSLSTANPAADLAAGMEFLRGTGLSGATTINAVFGAQALENFLNNESVKTSADFRRISRIDIQMPQFDNVSGMTFHGQYAAGDFIVNIWTYNETYISPVDNVTPLRYLNTNTVMMVANDFVGKTAFAGVPAIMGDVLNGQYIAPVKGEFYVRDVIDQVKMAWDYIISSAPLVVPVSVDRIYTLKTA